MFTPVTVRHLYNEGLCILLLPLESQMKQGHQILRMVGKNLWIKPNCRGNPWMAFAWWKKLTPLSQKMTPLSPKMTPINFKRFQSISNWLQMSPVNWVPLWAWWKNSWTALKSFPNSEYYSVNERRCALGTWNTLEPLTASVEWIFGGTTIFQVKIWIHPCETTMKIFTQHIVLTSKNTLKNLWVCSENLSVFCP